VKVLAVGDVMFSGRIHEYCTERGDWFGPLERIAPVLKEADAVIANLETPVIPPGWTAKRSGEFYGCDRRAVVALARVGVTVVCLANTHINDFGAEGVEATLEACRQAGIRTVGIGRTHEEACEPLIIDGADGVRIAVFNVTNSYPALHCAFGYVGCPLDGDLVGRQIEQVRQEVDYVVVSIHAGADQCPYASPEIRQFCRTLIDHGADLIYGHHSHVISGAESYRNGSIYYGLGNFLADFADERRRSGLMLEAEFGAEGRRRYEVRPLYIEFDPPQVAVAEGVVRDRIEGEFARLCRMLADGTNDEHYWATVSRGGLRQYWRGFWREYRIRGWRAIAGKVRGLRLYHLKLLLRLVGRAVGGWAPGRKGSSSA